MYIFKEDFGVWKIGVPIRVSNDPAFVVGIRVDFIANNLL